jgi:hypothetical protein
MKTFKDLKFSDYMDLDGNKEQRDGLHAEMFFPNGYGVSVIRFKMKLFIGRPEGNWKYGSYTSNEDEWEVGICLGTESSWRLTSDTKLGSGDSVVGHLTFGGVCDLMKEIQKL